MKKTISLLDNNAFTENPDHDFILKDERINEGIARLDRFLKNGIIALITGETGVGKTMLCKIFMNRLKTGNIKKYYLNLTSCKTSGILRQIMAKINGNYSPGYKDKMMSDFIEKTAQDNTTTILIIDEAHLLDDHSLVDLRLLASSIENSNYFKMILSGQEILRSNLKKDIHQALCNRITINYHIKQMDLNQSINYIDYQLRKSDLSDKTFSQEAKEKLHNLSKGIPRVINNIAKSAFIIAEIGNLSYIEPSTIENAYNDTML
jgi:general secretion pathway protein A